MNHATIPLLVAGASLVAACSSLTDVTAPGIVLPAAEENAAGAVARYVGAVRITTVALDSGISVGARWTDELISASRPGSGITTSEDARRPQNLTWQTGAIFTTFMNTRVVIGRAEEALRTHAPTPGGRLGQLYGYMGYIELYLAEMFCNGIPFSTIDDDGNVDYGGPVRTTEIYARAMAHFDSALAVSVDSPRVANLARVGRGRALLQLGRYAEAAAAVTAVPTSFVYNLDLNTNQSYGQTNVFYWIILNAAPTNGVPSGSDGTNGINWVAANDPRVPLYRKGLGTDGLTVIYMPTYVTSFASPQPIASGVEARLIEAEAALQANKNDAAPTGNGWLGILNTLRASATTPSNGVTPRLAALADPGTFDKRVDLLFREKALWTFLSGYRFGDLRRLVRQYGRAENTVWPSGLYRDGIPYGSEVNLEPPYSEAPNKNWTACLDRNA
jgi:hypothetical protein